MIKVEALDSLENGEGDQKVLWARDEALEQLLVVAMEQLTVLISMRSNSFNSLLLTLVSFKVLIRPGFILRI